MSLVEKTKDFLLRRLQRKSLKNMREHVIYDQSDVDSMFSNAESQTDIRIARILQKHVDTSKIPGKVIAKGIVWGPRRKVRY